MGRGGKSERKKLCWRSLEASSATCGNSQRLENKGAAVTPYIIFIEKKDSETNVAYSACPPGKRGYLQALK